VKRLYGSGAAVLYFLFIMWWVLLALLLFPLFFVMDVLQLREVGYLISGDMKAVISMLALFVGASLLLPGVKRMYYAIPWLFPLVKILCLNALILVAAMMTLSYGYEVQERVSKNIFFAIMIVQILISRLLMSYYLHKKPIRYQGSYLNTQTTEYKIENKETGQKLKNTKNIFSKQLNRFGGLLVLLFVTNIYFIGPSIDSSEAAKDALQNRVSTKIQAGTILLKENEIGTPQDYTILHTSKDYDTRIWIWSYADEGADYVQVIINNEPSTEEFLLRNKPYKMIVPMNATVQIKGVRGRESGITYAIRYEVNEKSYLNSVSVGEMNTYILKRE